MEVHRVETGEINVVNAMRAASREGALALIGMEGPNGGIILNGATARDGATTALLAAIALQDNRVRDIFAKAIAYLAETGRRYNSGLFG